MEQALQSANARVEELHRVLKQNVALQVGACMKLLLQKQQGPGGKCAFGAYGQTVGPVLREVTAGGRDGCFTDMLWGCSWVQFKATVAAGSLGPL